MNSVITPDRTRAIRIPNKSPDKTIESAEARRSGGARSAARGSTICGVTLNTPTRNERAPKAAKDDVTARPMVSVAESIFRSSMI